ncbi:hypothetical protein [Cupriavidus basilensis]
MEKQQSWKNPAMLNYRLRALAPLQLTAIKMVRKTTLITLGLLLCLTRPAHALDDKTTTALAAGSAAISAAISYCHGKYGKVYEGGPGAACFERAKAALSPYNFEVIGQRMLAKCGPAGLKSRCLTTEISDMVAAFLLVFDANKV